MKKFLVLVIYFLGILSGFTQTEKSKELDTLFGWLETNLQSYKDSTSLGVHSHNAIKIARKLGDSSSLAKSYLYLAHYHKEYSKLDSSLIYTLKAKDLYSTLKKELQLANTYLNLKEIYALQTEYGKATEQAYYALEIFEKLNNPKGVALSYAHLCGLLYYENRYSAGVDLCNKAIEIQKNLESKEDLALSYYYKAFNQLFSGAKLQDALTNINTAIELYKEIGENGIPMMAAINWRGNIYKYMGEYDKAIADYQANFDTSKELGLQRYLIPSLANIGHVFLMQGKYEEALPYNLEAIDIMIKTGRIRSLWENYMHVSSIYENMGDYRNALEYNKLYATAYTEIKDRSIQSLEGELQAKYETGQKNATILFQKEKINQQRKTQTLYTILVILLGVILFGLFYSYKKRQKRNKKLLELNNRLDIKNKQNELLLKEIHHRVKNNLELVKSLISLQSAQMEDSPTKEAMIASQNRVQSMGIIHQKLYQGENLGSIEMKDYFLNLGEGILDTFNAEDKVKIECAMDNLELDVDTAVPIGLIVNELLTNALKYAFPEDKNGAIQISLSQSTPETLTLKVADNGVGKGNGLASKGTGFGSQLIKLLTQQLNGTMLEKIEKGTTVEFQFKIKAAA
ncbi:MAG: histidine kinase [Flavobacteriaceae bacterium CG_4_8_14_3_um_filter_34_10]|nr:MAG: histidine kinase [Flavobacteriaceae bacterium CG02_land_8_20_14_3_00_34_13]PIX09034.1 MAG: histidine kinase [Flavobacteriaceae bacterium CG_4_8_14_3_um_filter_34_10]